MPVPKRRRLAAALGLAVVLAVLLSIGLSQRLAPRYTVADIGVLPGYASSSAEAINNQGVVACTVSMLDPSHRQACIYQQGRLTGLGLLPGASSSDASGINAAGDVTGDTEVPAGPRAFLYSGGRMRALDTAPGYSGSDGTAINDGGEVTGEVTRIGGQAGLTPTRALFYSQGKLITLPPLPGFSESRAQSINAAGQIAGVCFSDVGGIRCAPFLYDSHRKAMTALPLPPRYTWGFAYYINERGQVFGDISAGQFAHAARWDSGRLIDLGAPPGFTGAAVQGANGRGEAVGHCYSADGPIQTFLKNHVSGDNALRRYLDRDSTRAFVYRGGKMQDLNRLVPRDSGWTLIDARAINDRGQIVGDGLHHGQERGFLLTPMR